MIQERQVALARNGPGALDTSFWSAAAVSNAVGYALQLHELHAPAIVEREINSEDPPTQRPKAALFNALRAHGAIRITDARQVTVQLFGLGDRAVLSLARERTWPALINDAGPHAYGRTQMGILAVSVPELLVLAVHLGWLGRSEALAMLGRIEAITGQHLLRIATLAIERA